MPDVILYAADEGEGGRGISGGSIVPALMPFFPSDPARLLFPGRRLLPCGGPGIPGFVGSDRPLYTLSVVSVEILEVEELECDIFPVYPVDQKMRNAALRSVIESKHQNVAQESVTHLLQKSARLRAGAFISAVPRVHRAEQGRDNTPEKGQSKEKSAEPLLPLHLEGEKNIKQEDRSQRDQKAESVAESAVVAGDNGKEDRRAQRTGKHAGAYPVLPRKLSEQGKEEEKTSRHIEEKSLETLRRFLKTLYNILP